MPYDKKVSIVLPVYNGEEHIATAIESVLEQTYTNWELIIVNDCSTDSTEKILRGYEQQDSRIVIVNNPRNLKLPSSLNEGFNRACGDYYTWTSDDNIFRSTAIERLVNVLDSQSDISLVYSDFTLIDNDDQVIEVMHKPEPERLAFINSVGACFLYTSKIAKKVGNYDSNLFLAEDYDYWVRIWREGKVFHLQEDLYLYRLHDNSLTSTRQEAIRVQAMKVIEKHFLFLYSQMDTRKRKKVFLDNMVNWTSEDNRVQILSMIYSVYPNFYFHIHYNKMKAQLRRKLKELYLKIKREKGSL